MQKAHLWLGAALSVVACGSGSLESRGDADGGTGIDLTGLDRIDVTPGTLTLTIDGDTPQTATYTAMGHFTDGHQADITSATGFILDNVTLGSFSRNQLTTFTRNGGRATVIASAGNQTGVATLIVKIRETATDPQATGLPSDPGGAFGGTPSDTRKPDIVYPVDNVLLPPNLGKIELHFYPGAADAALFEISFQSDTTDVKIYTSCVNPTNGGCIYLPDATVWRWLAESNRGSKATVSVRGTAAAGAPVGTSTALTLAFSEDDIIGGMYYWTTPKGQTNNNAARIYRWDFGSTTQTEPQEIVTPADTKDLCVGCHTISPDGARLFVTSNGSYGARVLLRDLKTGQNMVPFDTTDRIAFASWEWPDGARYVGTFGNSGDTTFRNYDLNLYSGADGSFQGTIPVGGTDGNRSAQPDWSPDGTMIAFTRLGPQDQNTHDVGSTVHSFRSQIRIVTAQGTGWSGPVDLTVSEKARPNYYPAFSPLDENRLPYPNSALILYNRSSCANGNDGADCDMYDDPTAQLWIARAQAGATPIDLAKANAPGKTETRTVVENSFPKWTPFTFRRTGEFGTRLFWFTFSSDRKVGLRDNPLTGEVLLWMAGLDPDNPLQGEDGSFPAFLLPFQDIGRDNHTAAWTRKAVIIP